jgi:hypothetical protein
MPRIARTPVGAAEADACKPRSSERREHLTRARVPRSRVPALRADPTNAGPCRRRAAEGMCSERVARTLKTSRDWRCSCENSTSARPRVGGALYRSANVHRNGRVGATADSVGVGSADADSYADSTAASAEARSGADGPEASVPDASSPSDAPSAGLVRRLGSSDIGWRTHDARRQRCAKMLTSRSGSRCRSSDSTRAP